MTIDFKSINAAALSQLPDLLRSWLPGGRQEGKEWVCGDTSGAPGRSLSINTATGVWKDYASDEGGSDPVSLYAAIHNIGQGEAAKRLAQELGVNGGNGDGHDARRGKPSGKIVATYDYHDANGELVFQVCRLEPKSFRQRRPDGQGGWVWSVKGVELVPYRLPQLLEAQAVFVVEGEKDVDALVALGLTATCNAQGAGKWGADCAKHFQGKRACVLPDNDEPGRDHAQQVARSLQGVASLVKVLELPNLPEKGDVSDWLRMGGTRDELLRLAGGCSEWTPGEEPEVSDPDGGGFFASLNVDDYLAGRYIDEPTQPLTYVFGGPQPQGLKAGLVTRTVGLLTGDSGIGKSTFMLQIACGAASGHDFTDGVFPPESVGRVLVVCAEEDSRIVHKRINRIVSTYLPEGEGNLRAGALERLRRNLIVIPGSGEDLGFLMNDSGNPRPSRVYDEFLQLCQRIDDLALTVIDPFSRFFAGNENDSVTTTKFVALIEHVKEATGASILAVHHTAKHQGQDARGNWKLDTALSKHAGRGSSGLVGAARWQVTLSGVPATDANELLGTAHARDGQFLAGRVSKNNYGVESWPFYFTRGPGGVLRRVEVKSDDRQGLSDWLVDKLVAEVAKLEAEGKNVTARDMQRIYATPWKAERSDVTRTCIEAAIALALVHGRLFTVQRSNAKGRSTDYLSTTPAGEVLTESIAAITASDSTPPTPPTPPEGAWRCNTSNEINSLLKAPEFKAPGGSGGSKKSMISATARSARSAPLQGEEESGALHAQTSSPGPVSPPEVETIPPQVEMWGGPDEIEI